MNVEGIIKVINKYQGLLDSNVFPLLSKSKLLKESVLEKEKIEEIEQLIKNIKESEAKVIKTLNKYVSELEKTRKN